MKLDYKLTGFDEFRKMLDELPQQVETRVAQQATLKAMRSVRSAMRDAAPTHADSERSAASQEYGTLRSNIKVSRLKNVRKGQKGAKIHTGKAFWGFIYEFGSRYQPARPWFAPAFRALPGRLIAALGVEIGKGIEKEAAKVLKK